MKVISRGYYGAQDGISIEPWRRVGLSGDEPLLSILSDWDCSTELRVATRIDVDRRRVLDSTMLGAEAVVRVAAGWYCERTRSRAVLWRRDLTLDDYVIDALDVELGIPGSCIATSIKLEARLVLVERRKKGDALAARLPGTVLWHHDFDVALEPNATRFPIEWIDFATSVYPNDAAWVVEWTPEDLGRSTYGAVRLLLNRSHPSMASLLAEDGSSTTHLLWETMKLDVARQLVRGALADDDFVRNPDSFEWDSLGGTIHRMITNAFIGESMASLRSLLRMSPHSFEAQIQAKFGYMRDG